MRVLVKVLWLVQTCNQSEIDFKASIPIWTDEAMKSLELSFKLEDVFFTGILRHKANVKPPSDMTSVR